MTFRDIFWGIRLRTVVLKQQKKEQSGMDTSVYKFELSNKENAIPVSTSSCCSFVVQISIEKTYGKS